MVDDAIADLEELIKNQLQNGYKWQEVARLTLADIKLMSEVFEEKQTTIDKAFPFLF
ncbi:MULTISPECIES: hypothetical protein [Lactobacillaceae]|uniref:hypothetical protein n=1 Tax=Lactobacillaceae TaxID=33958 RepID=UPI0015DF9AE9|nr:MULTISPECIES: hypothetical protein [Lactobacillaceae]